MLDWSKQRDQTHTLKHRAVLTLVLVAVLYVIFFMKLDRYAVTLNTEIADTVEFVGEHDGNKIVKRSQLYYQLAQKYIPEKTVESHSYVEEKTSKWKQIRWASAKLSDLGDKLELLLYQCLFRWSLMQYWALTLAPIVAAMVFEGYKVREIKMYEFGMSSGKRQVIWLKSFAFLLFMVNVYMFLPYSSNFGPYYPPAAVLLSGFALKQITSHITKAF